MYHFFVSVYRSNSFSRFKRLNIIIESYRVYHCNLMLYTYLCSTFHFIMRLVISSFNHIYVYGYIYMKDDIISLIIK